jgi:twinkle protein
MDDMEVRNDAHSWEYWRQKVFDRAYAPPGANIMPKLPWRRTNHIFDFRPGEVSIIGGINGHGKTALWSQVILGLVEQGEKVGVASLEMLPELTIWRMIKQATAEGDPSPSESDAAFAWGKGKIFVYDKVGNVTPEMMGAVIRYFSENFGTTHFVVDNLTVVVSGDDNYNGQKDFMSILLSIAAKYRIHIHVIMHVRKGASEDEVPNKMSLKGSGAVTDMAHNVFIVWRNKKKERRMEEGDMALADQPDTILILDKQRNGQNERNEGRFPLWFHWQTNLFLEDRQAHPQAIRGVVLRPQNIKPRVDHE